MKRSLLLVLLLMVVALATACGDAVTQAKVSSITPAAQQESGEVDASIKAGAAQTLQFETLSNDEQRVWVEVTPLNLPQGGTTLDFEVAFNTHSVNLDFDPAAISVLRDDQGREYPALSWEGPGPGGHHRSGVLRFKVPDYATSVI